MTKLEEIRKRVNDKKQSDFNELNIHLSEEQDVQLANDLAEVEYSHYKDKSGSQITTSISSSIVGILGELAVYHELPNITGFSDPDWLAGKERLSILDGKPDYQSADLKCQYNNIVKAIEVKTIKFGDPTNQILVSHAHKYKNNGIDFVFFVQVMEFNGSWRAKIYNVADIDTIISSTITTNCFGSPCYEVKQQ